MCTLMCPYTRSKTFKGYKIAVQIREKYYSPFTGIEYRKRKIPEIEFSNDFIIKQKDVPAFKNRIILTPTWEEDYEGYTSVFGRINDTIQYYQKMLAGAGMRAHRVQLVLLEVIITDDLCFSDTWENMRTIAGKEILSCKKIKDLNYTKNTVKKTKRLIGKNSLFSYAR